MIQTLFGSLEEEKKTGFFDRMKQAVTRTRENLAERIEEVTWKQRSLEPIWDRRQLKRFLESCGKRPTANRSRTLTNSNDC
jgi:hypothetical protein